jgi:hypothetical protein
LRCGQRNSEAPTARHGCLSATVRCHSGLEDRPLWQILKQLVNALAELAALGVAFISLRDNLDLSTPSGRLMFQIIGAMAEFERALIQERVRAGLQNARAKGRRLGRPRVIVDAPKIASLRNQGRSWAQIVAETGLSKGTAQRAIAGVPEPFLERVKRIRTKCSHGADLARLF